MLKKGHKISKALTMAQLFGWSWKEVMFKFSRRAHWKVFKGRTRPLTSNRHHYIKKKGGLLDTALKKRKLSLPQAWTTILQESSGFASFTWCYRAATLTAKVREDLYFRTSSLTHS